jgi:hypothetical protein
MALKEKGILFLELSDYTLFRTDNIHFIFTTCHTFWGKNDTQASQMY